jgi:hypothetical protein
MRILILCVVAASALLVLEASAQSNSSGSFLTRLGKDTVAVERYTMSAHELSGTSIARNPQTTIRNYSATFDPNGKLERFHVTYQPFGKPVAMERDYVYNDDSVQVIQKQDTSVRISWSPVPGRPIPFFADLFGVWNAAVAQAITGPQHEFTVFAGRRALRYQVRTTSPGAVDLLNSDFGPMHAKVRADGQFDQFDMTETTDKFIIARVARLDVEGLGAAFAAREQSGRALGVLSPRDTVRVTVNGAHILIDFGRPSMRGRTIFGNVVPWDVVWRTGANAATQLMTDKELAFGTSVVPPGTYSVFTIPSKKGWMLIVNKQHGQWGTVYDQSKDLVRIPLATSPLSDSIEQFTFEAAAQDGGGILSFKWERTQASVSFVVH